ncbi:MAG TPA: histidine phosphatase family protein [Candidatus Acidoferrum sp.]|nr:histidine phosphatase family protein [Candidatus Acidoferrum sp.]
MKLLELRRHAPRDPERDALTDEGRALAERVGRGMDGPYDAVFSSPALRAAETLAWFLSGFGQPLPHNHAVVDALAGDIDDPTAVEALADALRGLFERIPEGRRGLAVGHTPLLEAAAKALSGQMVQQLDQCEGVLLALDDNGAIRVEREYRLGEEP